jgi:glycosyltransferase involved in cell wall biosynthesis
MPAYHALLAVRDEGDIIGECLDSLVKWADFIHVIDTGSIDSTWEIVLDRSLRHKSIIPLRKDNLYFSENLVRGWIFNAARENIRNGDWFLRVDADEFHHISPRDFVTDQLDRNETLVYHQYYHFCLLESEAELWEKGLETINDRAKPISERRRWYFSLSYSEPRMCLYRDTMRWPASVSFPYNAGVLARSRLPIRHYPNRDPLQLRRRCIIRSVMHEDPNLAKGSFSHWKDSDWRKHLTADCAHGLKQWRPGEPLEMVNKTDHLPSKGHQLLQRILHRTCIRHLDRRRNAWNSSDFPDQIPAQVLTNLQGALASEQYP